MDENIKRFKQLEKVFSPEPDLVAVEELADLLKSRPVRSRLQERLQPEPEAPLPTLAPLPAVLPSTKIVDKRRFPIPKSFTVIETDRPGYMSEVSIRSPSNNLSILVRGDGENKITRTYSQMEAISPQSHLIDAFQEDGTDLYCVRIGRLDWRSSFLFILYANTPIIFENVLADYTIYE